MCVYTCGCTTRDLVAISDFFAITTTIWLFFFLPFSFDFSALLPTLFF